MRDDPDAAELTVTITYRDRSAYGKPRKFVKRIPSEHVLYYNDVGSLMLSGDAILMVYDMLEQEIGWPVDRSRCSTAFTVRRPTAAMGSEQNGAVWSHHFTTFAAFRQYVLRTSITEALAQGQCTREEYAAAIWGLEFARDDPPDEDDERDA